MHPLLPKGSVTTEHVLNAAAQCGTPLYLYDARLIIARCQELTGMPSAFGLTVRYAMKANSSRSLLQLIAAQGLSFDASSLGEVRRAHLAGIAYDRMSLTTQEVYTGDALQDVQRMMQAGLVYNACSMRQLCLVADCAATKGIGLSMRVHPGIGSGESAARNTGDDHACFGIHLTDLPLALEEVRRSGVRITCMHVHIGSGADPVVWQQNIDRQLDLLGRYFPDAVTVNFGGGLKEARMPDEVAADLRALGLHAKQRLEAFAVNTGRKLHMEIEPGTYTVANAGYVVTEVIDKKHTGPEGFEFVVVNGGMEMNARPLLYGSKHPFYVVGQHGALRSSDWDGSVSADYEAVLVGRCCETGDAQSLSVMGQSLPRPMAEPLIGDLVAIGGAGAYCASMSLSNYNTHPQAPEVLVQPDGSLRVIRKRQTMEQMLANEC